MTREVDGSSHLCHRVQFNNHAATDIVAEYLEETVAGIRNMGNDKAGRQGSISLTFSDKSRIYLLRVQSASRACLLHELMKLAWKESLYIDPSSLATHGSP